MAAAADQPAAGRQRGTTALPAYSQHRHRSRIHLLFQVVGTIFCTTTSDGGTGIMAVEKPARHGRTATEPVPEAPRRERARRPKVLVADDDLDARTMYGLYLQRMGCTVFTAVDGESAVDQAMAVLPDLI